MRSLLAIALGLSFYGCCCPLGGRHAERSAPAPVPAPTPPAPAPLPPPPLPPGFRQVEAPGARFAVPLVWEAYDAAATPNTEIEGTVWYVGYREPMAVVLENYRNSASLRHVRLRDTGISDSAGLAQIARDAAQALRNHPGVTVNGITDVRMGGIAAKELDVSIVSAGTPARFWQVQALRRNDLFIMNCYARVSMQDAGRVICAAIRDSVSLTP